MEVYQLRANFAEADWITVTKKEWIAAERAAGFYPKLSHRDPKYADTCATGGFSGGTVSGRILHTEEGDSHG